MFGILEQGSNGWYDEAALIGAIGTFLTTVAVLWRQRGTRQRVAHHADDLSEKLDGITDTLNHTDQEVTADSGQVTLGQRVTAIQRAIEQGFAENDRVHALLGDAVHQNGQRVDAIRADVTRAHQRIDQLEALPPPTKEQS
jgi:hypothetical protein